MKKVFATAAILAITVMLASCGEDKKEEAPQPTNITSTTQGAQAAVLAAMAADFGKSEGSSLSSAEFAAKSRLAKSLSQRTARFIQKVKKAKAAIIDRATTTIEDVCDDDGSYKIVVDDAAGYMTQTYTGCKEYGRYLNGSVSLTCSDADCYSINESGTMSEIYYVQDYTNSTYEYTYKDIEYYDTGSASFTYALANNVETLGVTSNMQGWSEYFTEHYKDEYKDAGLSLSVNGTLATGLNVTMNGSSWWKHSEAGVEKENGTVSFSNLRLSDTYNAPINQFSIDGQLTLDLTPDTCAEGLYAFVTVTPVTFDENSGHYTAGELEINNAIVKFLADGTVQVSIDDGKTFTDYSDAELDALCPDL